jgi:DNA ligase-1
MIKQILDEISAVGGKNDKRDMLAEHANNDTLKRAIYLAQSPRVKFYIKQIPDYKKDGDFKYTLDEAMEMLSKLSDREVRGNEASEYLKDILEGTLPNDAYVIERIIEKNLKIGMDSGINKAIPNLIEETPYQGAKSFSEKGAKKLFDSGDVVISQVKADGTYRNAIIKDGVVQLVSRQGEVSHLRGTTFLDELKEYPDCVLNGELTIDGYERYEANGMVSSAMDIIEKQFDRGEEATKKKIAAFEKKHGNFKEALSKMRFTVWDIITNDEYQATKSDTPYEQRLDALMLLVDEMESTMISVVETKYIYTFAEAMEHFLDTQERGLEGTIIKSSTAGWKDGKPTYQIKMKLEMSIDLRITGFLYGNKGTKNENVISRLQVESSCGLLTTQPSGMKEAEMKMVTENQDKLLGTIVEVRSCGLSQNSDGEWSLMHPSVVEFRNDKNTCDSLETAKEIQEMAKSLENV